MCTIRERLNSFAALCHRIRELSNSKEELLFVHQLLIPVSWNLSCLYSTFHLEYPLVLCRYGSLIRPTRLRYGKMKELEISQIRLLVQCSLIELESSFIHLRISIIIDLSNSIGELSNSIKERCKLISALSN